jgi:hypothetical protein
VATPEEPLDNIRMAETAIAVESSITANTAVMLCLKKSSFEFSETDTFLPMRTLSISKQLKV